MCEARDWRRGTDVASDPAVRPRFLVVYGTTDGHTAKVAAAIVSTLRTGGASVSLRDSAAPANPDPADYDAVIVAASVHVGNYQSAIRRWVGTHQAALNNRPTAFVSVCLAVLNRNPKVDIDLAASLRKLSEATGWQPTETKIVAGALLYRQYGWIKRWMMRRIVAKEHGDTDTSRDYEYTDWHDLAEFVTRFQAGVTPQVQSRELVGA